jgi:hypothetical protein
MKEAQMARQEAPVTIDKHKYLFTQLDPRRAARVYVWLLGIIGGTVGGAVGSLKGGKGIMDADVDLASLGKALEGAFLKLDDDKTFENIDTLLSCVLFGGENMSLDHLNFQGGMLHLTKVVKKSVEVNFSDFLEGSSGLVGRVKGVLAMIQGRRTSTGSSGDQSSPE